MSFRIRNELRLALANAAPAGIQDLTEPKMKVFTCPTRTRFAMRPRQNFRHTIFDRILVAAVNTIADSVCVCVIGSMRSRHNREILQIDSHTPQRRQQQQHCGIHVIRRWRKKIELFLCFVYEAELLLLSVRFLLRRTELISPVRCCCELVRPRNRSPFTAGSDDSVLLFYCRWVYIYAFEQTAHVVGDLYKQHVYIIHNTHITHCIFI